MSKKSAIVTVRMTIEEKKFIEKMAKFEGKTVSEIIKGKTLEALEDEYDIRVAEQAYQDYLNNGEQSISLEDYAKELDIDL